MAKENFYLYLSLQKTITTFHSKQTACGLVYLFFFDSSNEIKIRMVTIIINK